MNIQCPACHASSRLPESKEGAKVRCGACGHVYVARELGAKRAAGSPTPWILGGAGVLALGLVGWLASQDDEPAGTRVAVEQEPPPPPPAPEEGRGWDSAPVRAVRAVHDATYTRDSIGLQRLLARERVFAARHSPQDLEQGLAAWRALSRDEQVEFQTRLVEELVQGESEVAALIATWKPFDGTWVETNDMDEAVVRVQVQPRDSAAGLETRTLEWRLVRDEVGRWLAAAWQRWVSPEEEKAARIAHSRLTQQVTLSDGSRVFEAELTELEHLPDTSPELRERIDGLFATMIDLSEPKAGDRALEELVAIGKPALPILLNGFHDIPLETEEQAIQVNLIVRALKDITGQDFGYEPQVMEGSGTGTTAERRASALKQYFAWWHRRGEKFTEKQEAPDLFEESVIPTQRELRMIERDAQKQDKNP